MNINLSSLTSPLPTVLEREADWHGPEFVGSIYETVVGEINQVASIFGFKLLWIDEPSILYDPDDRSFGTADVVVWNENRPRLVTLTMARTGIHVEVPYLGPTMEEIIRFLTVSTIKSEIMKRFYKGHIHAPEGLPGKVVVSDPEIRTWTDLHLYWSPLSAFRYRLAGLLGVQRKPERYALCTMRRGAVRISFMTSTRMFDGA